MSSFDSEIAKLKAALSEISEDNPLYKSLKSTYDFLIKTQESAISKKETSSSTDSILSLSRTSTSASFIFYVPKVTSRTVETKKNPKASVYTVVCYRYMPFTDVVNTASVHVASDGSYIDFMNGAESGLRIYSNTVVYISSWKTLAFKEPGWYIVRNIRPKFVPLVTELTSAARSSLECDSIEKIKEEKVPLPAMNYFLQNTYMTCARNSFPQIEKSLLMNMEDLARYFERLAPKKLSTASSSSSSSESASSESNQSEEKSIRSAILDRVSECYRLMISENLDKPGISALREYFVGYREIYMPVGHSQPIVDVCLETGRTMIIGCPEFTNSMILHKADGSISRRVANASQPYEVTPILNGSIEVSIHPGFSIIVSVRGFAYNLLSWFNADPELSDIVLHDLSKFPMTICGTIDAAETTSMAVNHGDYLGPDGSPRTGFIIKPSNIFPGNFIHQCAVPVTARFASEYLYDYIRQQLEKIDKTHLDVDPNNPDLNVLINAITGKGLNHAAYRRDTNELSNHTNGIVSNILETPGQYFGSSVSKYEFWAMHSLKISDQSEADARDLAVQRDNYTTYKDEQYLEFTARIQQAAEALSNRFKLMQRSGVSAPYSYASSKEFKMIIFAVDTTRGKLKDLFQCVIPKAKTSTPITSAPEVVAPTPIKSAPEASLPIEEFDSQDASSSSSYISPHDMFEEDAPDSAPATPKKKRSTTVAPKSPSKRAAKRHQTISDKK